MLDPIIVGKVIQKAREDKNRSQEVIRGLADLERTHLIATTKRSTA